MSDEIVSELREIRGVLVAQNALLVAQNALLSRLADGNWVWATYSDGPNRDRPVALNLDAQFLMQRNKVPKVGGIIGQQIEVTKAFWGGCVLVPTAQGGYVVEYANAQFAESMEELLAAPRIPAREMAKRFGVIAGGAAEPYLMHPAPPAEAQKDGVADGGSAVAPDGAPAAIPLGPFNVTVIPQPAPERAEDEQEKKPEEIER